MCYNHISGHAKAMQSVSFRSKDGDSMILYIDAAVRSGSRTAALAERVLKHLEGEVRTLRLCEYDFPVLDEAFLAKRDRACAAGDLSDACFEPAKLFAGADEIVIAAPYYDLSFPAALKQFFEQINVIGLTFGYTEEGKAYSKCRARRLIYVTTAGGSIASDEYGFGYVKALAGYFYGIRECVCFKAEGLDIYGADVPALLDKAGREIDAYFAVDN